jgi:4-phytase/acid phosphatase
MTIFGAWYRRYFAQQHLLLTDGCTASTKALVRADIDQRTRETARALAKGFFSGCQVEVDVLPKNKADPLFHPLRAGIAQAGTRQAMTAVLDRIGGNPETLAVAYDHPFESLREVLLGCNSKEDCDSDRQPGKDPLRTLSTSLTTSKDGLVDLRGPIRTGSTLAENLCSNMPMA